MDFLRSTWRVGLALLGATCLWLDSNLKAAPSEALSTPEHAYLSFLDNNVVRFPAESAEKSFFLRLPEHVRYREGSKLVLLLHGDESLLRDLCSLRIYLNGASLFEGPSGYELSTNRSEISLIIPVPANFLVADWNRISLVFVLQKPEQASAPSRAGLDWEVRRAESFFDFAFERVPLFPELRRFPLSLTEEDLLQTGSIVSRSAAAAAVILMPRVNRDIYARSLAVLGTTLGKSGYLNDCRLGDVDRWAGESQERNGILVARRDELPQSVLPDHIGNALARLREEEGLIAEVITGTISNQHRWIILSGTDDVGLEKALLTIAHGPALLAAPPNPSVIRSHPLVAGPLEEQAMPGPAVIPLRTPQQPDLHFQGIYQSDQTFTGWKLPPGYATGQGGSLNLVFMHAPALIPAGSYFEVLVNGVSVGTVSLSPASATNGTVQISLPGGLRGYETMSLTFRAYLDLPTARCDPPATSEAWLTISGESFIESIPDRANADDLRQLQMLLLRDLFLRRTAFLLPAEATSEERQWFLDFCLTLGQKLSTSSILWPEALWYDPETTWSNGRLRDKTVVIFGSLAQTTSVLPPIIHPLIQMDEIKSLKIGIQGSNYSVKQFEPSMAILMLHASPWSAEDRLITAGGFQTFALPALHRMMNDEQSAGKKYGVVSAMDDQGRWTGYDPTQGADPLVDSLLKRLPKGLSVEQTLLRERDMEVRSRRIHQINFAVMVWFGFILLLLITCRVWLTWERSHLHRKKGNTRVATFL